MKNVLLVVLLPFLFLWITEKAIADNSSNSPSSFSVSYDITYAVDENGQTKVVQKGLLTNLTDDAYVSRLDIHYNSANISDVSAYDDFGLLTPRITKDSKSTALSLNLNRKLLGIGKNINFTVSYLNPDIAQKSGRVWIIRIPPAENSNHVIAYNINLEIPDSFGQPSFISPKPKTNLSWSKDQLGEKSIEVAFGDFQSLDFTFDYHASNFFFWYSRALLSLPSQVNGLKIIYSSFSPKPLMVTGDNGIQKAVYLIYPFSALNAEVTGQLHVYPNFSKSFWELNNMELTNYLARSKNVTWKNLRYSARLDTDDQNILPKYHTAAEKNDILGTLKTFILEKLF